MFRGIYTAFLIFAFAAKLIAADAAAPAVTQLGAPDQVAGNSYNIVSQPTDQCGLFVTTTPLPADYGQTTITPITKYDVQIQQNLQALEMTAIFLATVATDTEEAAPDLLAADASAAGNTFFHYTQAEIPAGQGLTVGSGVTSVGNLNASEAMFQLGIRPPTYVYPVTLENPLDFLSINAGAPIRNGLPIWRVEVPTPSGSVGLPSLVPRAP